MFDLRNAIWEEHPANPLISPPGREWLIADPALVAPADAPDGRFHLFAHSLRGIHHYVSADGVAWDKLGGVLFPGLRPFVFVENGFHLFYERFERPWRSVIAVRSSPDLVRWSAPRTVLAPSLPWEGVGLRANSCPGVVRHEGRYRLYFSAAWVWLEDCYFIEPKHIGVAESDLLLGPYTKWPRPILSPSPELPWRNLSAGSLKVIPPERRRPWLGFQNGISVDDAGRSRSAIRLLESDDGLDWRETRDGAIVAPSPGWKEALVYAMAPVFHKGELRLYFNARDGWFRGTERIGLVTARPGQAPAVR